MSSPHVEVEDRDGVRWVTLSRPRKRNAMSFQMLEELRTAVSSVTEDTRLIALRGAGGNFCAGGDIKDMAAARHAEPGPDGRDPIAAANRRFGTMLYEVQHAAVPVVAVCEGAVMGGGFGLACVADVTLAVEGARFRLPETGLGLTPAQVMPFIVRRIGLTQARRLAVTGASLDSAGAVSLGLAHEHVTEEALDAVLTELIGQIKRCAPQATAATKQLALSSGNRPLEEELDAAAEGFAALSRGDEAMAGMLAFLSKEAPPWA